MFGRKVCIKDRLMEDAQDPEWGPEIEAFVDPVLGVRMHKLMDISSFHPPGKMYAASGWGFNQLYYYIYLMQLGIYFPWLNKYCFAFSKSSHNLAPRK